MHHFYHAVWVGFVLEKLSKRRLCLHNGSARHNVLMMWVVGVEGSVIVGKILESDNPAYGYDAATGKFGDLTKWGIIDPLKVVRTALMDAASVSSLITTSEAVVVEAPEDKKAAAPSGGYPGGMDHMY